jgi:nicotinamidase-related amidase
VSTRAGSASALIVVDLQVGVLADCVDVDGTLTRVQATVERARAAGITVVWVQDEQDFPRHSPGWELAPPLAPRPGEARVFKDYRDAFADTELSAILGTAGVTRLLVAGAQSDFCVRTAAQSAAARGYDVTLISDAHTTSDAEMDGQAISGAAIIAHTNRYFAGLRYPGQTFAVAPHDTVGMGRVPT